MNTTTRDRHLDDIAGDDQFTTTQKTEKLLVILNGRGFDFLEDLARVAMADSTCPAVCMTEGCDHIDDLEKDSEEGHCDACGGQTMVSALRLAGLV
jgi:hypothetical protein